ncbi:MAG: NCLDV major capsid protein [Hyperionvirus sp.]|uniref:NCLDV major capsid protein n=1 Tax=Hyperionvirus sp. TaxID=2487770 RepID=A0A3G5ADH0_9VIRU|nr:MAG: NCLDV major capsid protein [Hyperionvirus sp.]
MGGGLIQLVAYGIQDLFLTRDPQITFFKIVYRRHSNFSIEPIPQQFTQPLDFNKKSTCILSRQGDLIGQTYLVLTLPCVNLEPLYLFAWVRKIGFALIKTIDLIINEQLIDRHYGEWLNIWYELMGPLQGNGFNKMIGNISELAEFTPQKDSYEIHVPLQFWFCRNSGSALPLVCLQYSEVKINVELNDLEKCSLLTPTHYIETLNDFVNLKPFEYIEQNLNGKLACGIYTNYDFINKRLYYMKLSKHDFQASFHPSPISGILDSFSPAHEQYIIKGITTNFIVFPKLNCFPQANIRPKLNICMGKCFLLIDYIFLDEDERMRFLQGRHDYLIEQVGLITEQTIDSSNVQLNIDLSQPCKFFVWLTQYLHYQYIGEGFNYTDCYMHACGKSIGRSLVLDETFLLNGRERLSNREYKYFNYVQSYQNFPYPASEGLNVYSFALTPEKFQPSGSCNMSQIDNLRITMRMNPYISPHNPVKFRGYAVIYNILRIVNGIAGVVFRYT